MINCIQKFYNAVVLLVSNGEILCDFICACSDDSHEYA